jgi:hypothetical protein
MTVFVVLYKVGMTGCGIDGFLLISLVNPDFMKPAEFTKLPAQQQLDTLYRKGDILANRYEGDHIFLLYNLRNFYVELRYDAYTNSLYQVSAFQDTEKLEPYLPYLA